MAKKKDEPNQSTDQQLLEQRVDAMMDPKREEPVAEDSSAGQTLPVEPTDGLPPLDIFSGTGAPDVPKELLKGTTIKKAEAKVSNAAPAKAEPGPDTTVEVTQGTTGEAELDDDVSDAAVDDIVAQEGDTVLATEDAATKEQEPTGLPKKKAHRHPVFWTLVTIIAILAALLGFLLVTGGNVNASGTKSVDSLWHSLQRRL